MGVWSDTMLAHVYEEKQKSENISGFVADYITDEDTVVLSAKKLMNLIMYTYIYIFPSFLCRCTAWA